MTPPSIKIAIAARGLSFDPSGPTEFIHGFTGALLEAQRGHKYTIYYNSPELIGQFPAADERSLPLRNRFIWDHLLLPLALRRDGVDVAIFPKGTMPLWGARQAVVVMHDLGYFYPDLQAYRPLESAYLKNGMRRVARRAWGIFAVSEFTRRDVIRILDADPEKVHTIYEAPAGQYAPVRDEDALSRARARYRLPEPFIFYPTSISPRKNIQRLLEALDSVRDRIPHHLVLTGGQAWNSRELENALGRYAQGRVHRLGVVAPQDMPALYSLADFTVYISIFEGFGLPVLEAMRCGSPVMVSAQASLQEVAGGAAFVVDGYDVGEMAEGLVSLAADNALRADLRQKGFARAPAFSWARTAELALDWIETRWGELNS
ncbi:MAG: glycosyltransferase family 1 protein [Anaerolineales bacterium]|nr:glycosyltransferase family 1 protein [Anaerolineales bacterium]